MSQFLLNMQCCCLGGSFPQGLGSNSLSSNMTPPSASRQNSINSNLLQVSHFNLSHIMVIENSICICESIFKKLEEITVSCPKFTLEL